MAANEQACREALEALVEVVEAWKDHLPPAIRDGELSEALEKANSALSAPRRNCDVGTAEEQDKRFYHMFCRASIDGCVKCKLDVLPHRGNTCGIHWAQMPYEEGGDK